MSHLQRIFLLLVLVVLGGCPKGGSGDSDGAASARSANIVKLNIEGVEHEFKVDSFGIMLVDEGELPPDMLPQESFEMIGDDLYVTGMFPVEVRVDYEENWDSLMGNEIRVLDQLWDNMPETESYLNHPEWGRCDITGGTIVFSKYSESLDSRTPLVGTITLDIQTPNGQVTAEGTMDVDGITWG